MTKTRGELWRKDRIALVEHAMQGSALVQALNNRLEGLREAMHEEMGLPPPNAYASTSVDNIKRLCDDLQCLTVALVLRAKGLTCEADEELADGMIQDIEEIEFGYASNTRRH